MTLEKGKDYIGVGVLAICHDGQGNVFLNKRSEKCRDEWGKWDNWGGGLEFGEEFEAGLRRELKEEMGAEPLKIEFGGVENVLREQDGQLTHWVGIAYAALVDPKLVKNGEPEKFLEVGWFEYGQWPENRHSYFDRDVAKVTDVLKKYPGFHSLTDRTAAS